MSDDIENLKRDVEAIKNRNLRVEAEKAWETSAFRTVSIAVATYIIAGAVLAIIEVSHPWRGAFIPAIGYLLSVQSLPALKRTWIRRYLARRGAGSDR